MRQFLLDAGHDADAAMTAREALDLIDRRPYDVVVLDIILPEVNGLSLLAMIRKSCPDTVVIMITGEPTFETAAEAVRSGAFDYLSKPVSSEKLCSCVAKASRIAALQVENRQYRERLEKLVDERSAELRKSERRYRLLAENATDLIFTMNLEFGITYCSPSVTRIRGYTVEEMMSLDPVDNIAPSFLEKVMKVLNDELSMDRDADPTRVRTLELELTNKDGTTAWHEMSLTFLRDDEGKPVEVLGVSRDITRRRQVEEQLRQSQKMEAMGRLAGGVSHDFNNLLSAILGYASLLKSQVGTDSPLFEDIEEIEKAGQRASNLTGQLLAFSRKGIREPEVLSVNDVITDTLRMLRRIIGEDIQLDTSLEEALPAISADRGHIEQILVNLAVNARDAMPEGGELSIRTSRLISDDLPVPIDPELRAPSYVKLEVSDTGGGIAPDVIEHIFEPFFTTKVESRGTGLGLSTVYGIVRQSGGEIRVESDVGKGTRFEVILPASLSQDVTGAARKESTAPAPSSESVLVVEDDDAVRALTVRILEERGYSVLAARNGHEALRVSAEHAGVLHLLLSDVVMPGMSGKELADRLVQSRPDMRVLFMSGYTDDVIASQGVLDDGVMLVPKPFEASELLSAVEKVLGS